MPTVRASRSDDVHPVAPPGAPIMAAQLGARRLEMLMAQAVREMLEELSAPVLTFSMSASAARLPLSRRPRATQLLKISLAAPQGASTHVANSGVGRTRGL